MKHYVSKWDNASARIKSGILYWLITLFVIIIYAQNLQPLQSLEFAIEDQIRSSKQLQPDQNKICVVAIDARSVDKVGQWPWDHGRISDLLITICDYKPKAVMLDFPLAERVEEFLVAGILQFVFRAHDEKHDVAGADLPLQQRAGDRAARMALRNDQPEPALNHLRACRAARVIHRQIDQRGFAC